MEQRIVATVAGFLAATMIGIVVYEIRGNSRDIAANSARLAADNVRFTAIESRMARHISQFHPSIAGDSYDGKRLHR